MIFDKIKSNHNFNQTHILYEPTTAKMIFFKIIFFKSQPQQLPQKQTHSELFLLLL